MLPFKHIINIDKENKIAVYRQIAVSIIMAIRNGVLKPRYHLPGTRELSKALEKRSTINAETFWTLY
ncbi:hypothetical protein [Chryseobacterium sp. W4I1]|uniref:hypothetical protein n=1 Tax=Chryseobacterium sp. W4I1 TaxID=3042293 RepID=UPI002788F146|nr:hypothetical protein [Chryseobacterium sp. W4I1]MDQ0782082.1 DNA-binding transcriptional regulator YhcF (GntR family) [Chryseobacterium sp. W4I1]